MTKIIAGMAFGSVLQAATIIGVGRGVDQAYTVKKGDSLWKISQSFYGTGFRAEQLKKTNGLKSDLITEGQKIMLPALFLRLRVVAGDTLSTISEEFFCGASRYKALAKYNKLSAPYHIREGQVLRLPLHSIGKLIPCDSLIVRGGGTAEPVRSKRVAAPVSNIASSVLPKTNKSNKCPEVPEGRIDGCSGRELQVVPVIEHSKQAEKKQYSPVVVREVSNKPEPVPFVQKEQAAVARETNTSPRRRPPAEGGFRGLLSSIKRLSGSQDAWQRRDSYEKRNPRNFSTSVEFLDYKPDRPVVSNPSIRPVKSIMPVYRISQGVGRGGDASVIFGHWDSSETDVLSSVYKNNYSLAGVTISVTELLDHRVGFRAEAGLVEYVHKATVTNNALFGTISSTARNMGYLFSAGLRYRINSGLDLSLTWMKFGGRFRHPDFGPSPVETEMGGSAFGFGLNYRF